MTVSSSNVESSTIPSSLSDALHRFVAEQASPEATESWVERVSAPLLAQSPEVAGDAVLARSVRAAVRAHWQAFVPSLEEPEGSFRLVVPAAELAADLARRGNHLTLLFRLYRIAQHEVWTHLTALTPDMVGSDRGAADFLVFVWGRASSWLDASVEESVDVFQREHDRIRQGRAAQRLDAVRAILDGTDGQVRELSAALGGHPLSSYQTAMLLHTDDAERVAELQEAAGVLARALQNRNPLIVSPGGHELWLWAASRDAPDLSLLEECRPWLEAHEVSLAVGTPAEGIAGFRLSHQEAQQAQAIALHARHRDAVTTYPQVELLCLLAASGDATRRFVTRTLGDLADDGEGPERLRETLRAFLSTGSVDLAATALTVHKNTVRYRIAQAETLLGRPVRGAAVEIDLALRCYDTFLAGDRATSG